MFVCVRAKEQGRNVVLVGMMGSGKTTTGKLLAEQVGVFVALLRTLLLLLLLVVVVVLTAARDLALLQLGYEFVDTDEFIETQLGVSIGELFAQGKEQEFRQAEHGALKRVGGVILAPWISDSD